MAQLRRTREPQKRIFCCASCTHDVLTAVASVSDIVFDVLVAVQFYRDHHMVFCTLSIIIFAIAQAAYAFLFTSAYASHLSIAKRLLVFVAVLPIAQITPVFAWIESLHWPALQRLMLRMDLRPSDDVEPGDGDSLWLHFRSKFAAHSGFLAEALLEAVPQCVLQTAHIMWVGQVDVIPLISILLSVVVIVTKGWVVSFSLHRPTLAFNILCTAGDIFGLFAIVCWTFSKVQNQHPDELLVYLTAPAFLRTINGVLVASLGIAAAALVAGDLVLLVFGLFEEALCDRRRNRLAMPLFLRLVVAPIAWALAQLPLIVLLGTLRLSLLPLVVFRSLDSEHAIHASFYRPIFAYLAHGKGAGFDDECQQAFAMDVYGDGVAAIELQEAGDARHLDHPFTPGSAPACTRSCSSLPRSGSAGLTPSAASSERAASRADRLTSSEPPGLRRTETRAEECCDAPARPVRRASAGRAPPDVLEAVVLDARPVGEGTLLRLSDDNDDGAVVVAAAHQPTAASLGRPARGSPPRERECEQLRTLAVNAFIACARRDVHSLRERLRHARSRRARHLAAAEFVASVGLPKDARYQMLRVAGRQADVEAGADEPDEPGMEVGTMPPAALAAPAADGVIPWHDGLGITIPWLLRAVPGLSRAPEPLASPCSSGPVDGLLQACAIFCILLAVPLVAVWAAATLVYIPLAAALPIIGPALCLSRRQPLPLLATALSACYLSVVLAGLFLAPSVRSFQRMRVQLRGAAAFPNAFYCGAVAKVIAERCEAAVQTALAYSRRARAPPLLRYGCVCSICMGQIRPGQRVRELLTCSHSFHEDCILSWIYSTASAPCCPNCRQPATLDDLQALDPMRPHNAPARASPHAAQPRV